MSGRPGARFVVGAALALGVALAFLAGWTPDLPGPRVRERLGLAEEPPEPCKPSAAGTRVPSGPPPAPGRWHTEPAPPEARNEFDAATVGRQILLPTGFGGRDVNVATVTAYDPGARTYTRLPNAPIPLDHAMAVGHGGDLYLVGGYTEVDRPSKRVFRYSSASRAWTEMPPMRHARGAAAGAVIGDRLYVAGGASTNRFLLTAPFDSVEVFDLGRGEWTTGPPMPTGRQHAAAEAVDGRLYVAGGRSTTSSQLRNLERLDPRSGRWEVLPPLPQGTSGAEGEAIGGEFVVTGGEDPTAEPGWVTPATWAFDPARTRWRRLPDMRVARHGHASAVHGGRLYVFEGVDCVGGFGGTETAESLPVR